MFITCELAKADKKQFPLPSGDQPTRQDSNSNKTGGEFYQPAFNLKREGSGGFVPMIGEIVSHKLIMILIVNLIFQL